MSTTNTATLPLTTKASAQLGRIRIPQRGKKERHISEEDRKVIAELQKALKYANSENATWYTLEEVEDRFARKKAKWKVTKLSSQKTLD